MSGRVPRNQGSSNDYVARHERILRRRHLGGGAAIDLGFAEFRVSGHGQDLWPFNSVIFSGNVSLDSQVELLKSITMYVAAPVGGSKVIDCIDQDGATTTTIELRFIALTQTDGVTLRSSALEVSRLRLSGDYTGAGGEPVPFNSDEVADGTYFTTQDNGDGTYSPVIHLRGLYVITLWATNT